MGDGFLIDDMIRYIGQTVTIFTTSGGLSGSGFTGVLACVGECTIKLITDIGAPPACPVCSSCISNNCACGGGYGGYGYGGGYGGYGYGGGCGGGCGCGGGFGGYSNFLGSVTEIPIYVRIYTLLDHLCLWAFSGLEVRRDLCGSLDV